MLFSGFRWLPQFRLNSRASINIQRNHTRNHIRYLRCAIYNTMRAVNCMALTEIRGFWQTVLRNLQQIFCKLLETFRSSYTNQIADEPLAKALRRNSASNLQKNYCKIPANITRGHVEINIFETILYIYIYYQQCTYNCCFLCLPGQFHSTRLRLLNSHKIMK